MTGALTPAEESLLVAFRTATRQGQNVLGYVLERWNGLTFAQQARVFRMVDRLHAARQAKSAGRMMVMGGGR